MIGGLDKESDSYWQIEIFEKRFKGVSLQYSEETFYTFRHMSSETYLCGFDLSIIFLKTLLLH